MLTLCTLLPSDNEALLGHSEQLYAPLLRPSDNIPPFLGRSLCAHYIEYISNILPKYILYYHIIPYDNIPYDNISYDIIPSDNIWCDKVLISEVFYTYMCDPPPSPKKNGPPFYGRSKP
jgi:hypothetical protein